MIAVIFEATPHPTHREDYFAAAAALRPFLEEVEGFVSVERFESLAIPGKLLSLSFFTDEAAVTRWRRLEQHRRTQAVGRDRIFADYRLRVASVVRDYGLNERAEAPGDSQGFHQPAPPERLLLP